MSVSRPELESQKKIFKAFIEKWNASINLMSPKALEEFEVRHWGDSLTAVGVLESLDTDMFIDFGSGGGFPALPLACALPEKKFICVEKVLKKRTFLKQAAQELGIASRVSLVESMERALEAYPHKDIVITMRAVTVNDLIEELEKSKDLLEERAVSLFYWGKLQNVPRGTFLNFTLVEITDIH